MQHKIPNQRILIHLSTFFKPGLSIVEVVLSVALLILILGTVVLNVNARENRMKTRDTVRLNDLQTLDRLINEFFHDSNWVYPDTASVLRMSHVVAGTASRPEIINQGWIVADFDTYAPKLPIDPTNDATYHYEYFHNGSAYELNAVLEYMTSEMTNDAGNDPDRYEIGTDLTLISP